MNGMDGSGGAARLLVMLAVGLIGLASVCERAVGQVRSIESKYVTVVGDGSDGAMLRCGPDVIWYAVAGVRTGEVLEVDGEKGAWYRAGYPVDGRVVVKLNEGQHIQGEDVVVLKRRSRLRAYNPQDPIMEECWKGVFPDNQLPMKTKLLYVGDMMDRSGAHAGYVAVAPEGARGFILKRDVRDATAEEIAVFRGERDRISDLADGRQTDHPIRRQTDTPVIGRDGAIEAQRAMTEPAREEIAQHVPVPVEDVVEEPAVVVDATIDTEAIDDALSAITEPADAAPESGWEEVGAETRNEWSLGEVADQWAQGTGEDEAVSEVIDPVDEPAVEVERAAMDEPVIEIPAQDIAVVDAQEMQDAEDYRQPDYSETEYSEPVYTKPVRTGRVLTLSELDAAYDRVVSRSGENPEYETVIEEYKRHVSRLSDEPGADRTRAYIQTRVQLLEIAAELAQGEAELAALMMDAESAGTEVARLARRVHESSEFDLVGRLVSSAVYDGDRLPMLYRLVSVEGRVGRTVAYLTDDAALEMDGKLGLVVGVRGEGMAGEVGLVRVIRPEEVIVLTGVASAEWSE